MAAAVLPAFVGPHHHIAGVRQVCNRWCALGTGQRGVDYFLGTKRYRTIRLCSDIDCDGFGQRNAAVAVRQAERNGPARLGIGQKVLVGEVFYQRFGRFWGGAGIEQHRQRVAVDPVRQNSTYHHGTCSIAEVVGNVIARHTNLFGAGAFVADA